MRNPSLEHEHTSLGLIRWCRMTSILYENKS